MSNKKIKVFAGRYAYVKPLGRGAGGSVYLAEDLHSDRRQVALKVLTPEACATVQGKMLRREFEILSKLNHANLVSVYDYGSLPDGGVFLAEEYIDGFSLQDARALLNPEALIDLTMQILNGLSYVHGMGMIHRDIKPANVMLLWLDDETAEPKVKLVDFGLSSMDPKRDTLRGGTRSYMAPEIIRGEKGEPQSDLFSLGVTLYYVLCGVLPFGPRTKDDPPPTEENFRPPEPHRLNPDVPLALSRFTMALLRQVDDVQFMDAGEAMQSLARDIDSSSSNVGRFANNMQIAAPEVIRGYFERGVVREQDRQHKKIVEALTMPPEDGAAGTGYLIVGESQTGKSRLVHEIATSCKLRGRLVIEVNCQKDMWPWQVMWSVLTRCWELTRHRKSNPLEAYAHSMSLLSQMMTLPFEEALLSKQQAGWIELALKDALNMLHADRLMLCLEDLHLADDVSLNFLTTWFQNPHGRERMDVVMTASPDDRLSSLAAVRTIKPVLCEGLVEEDVRYFMSSRLGLEGVPESFVVDLSARASGVPAYFEEVCRHLVDEGVLSRESATVWKIDLEELEQFNLPQSLQESFRRRMTTSGAAGRELLELLTLSETPLPWVVLRELSVKGGESADSVERAIEMLHWRHLVQIDLDMSGRTIRLVHPAVRDVVSGLLSPEWAKSLNRRLGEALFARWLQKGGDIRHIARLFSRSSQGARAAQCAMLAIDVAEPNEPAHDMLALLDDISIESVFKGQDAVLFTLSLARAYLGRFDSENPSRLLESAAAQAEEMDEGWLMYQVYVQAASVYLQTGQLEKARAWSNRVRDMLPAFAQQSLYIFTEAKICLCLGEIDRAQTLAKQLIQRTQLSSDIRGQIDAYSLLAQIMAVCTDAERASKYLQSAYDLASAHKMTRQLGVSLMAHARLLLEENTTKRALKLFLDALDATSINDEPSATLTLMLEVASCALTLGQFDVAERRAIEALILSRALGHNALEAVATITVAAVAIAKEKGSRSNHVERMTQAFDVLLLGQTYPYETMRSAGLIAHVLSGYEQDDALHQTYVDHVESFKSKLLS